MLVGIHEVDGEPLPAPQGYPQQRNQGANKDDRVLGYQTEKPKPSPFEEIEHINPFR